MELIAVGVILLGIILLVLIIKLIEKKEKELKRIQEEENRIKRLQAIVDEELPQPEIVDISAIDCDGNLTTIRINNDYKGILEEYNDYVCAENEFKWLERKIDARAKLNQDKVEDEERLKVARDKRDTLLKHFYDFQRKEIDLPYDLKKSICYAKESVLSSMKGMPNDGGATNMVDAVFFKGVPYIRIDTDFLFLLNTCCVLKDCLKNTTPVIIDYSELKVKKITYTIKSSTYSYVDDELVRVTYRHEKKDGTRDRRYLPENNPATYHIKKSEIILKVREKSKSFVLKRESRANEIERNFNKLVDIFNQKEVKALIDKAESAFKENCRAIRSTK
ncbi:MAG: hypothetical protein IJA82_06760 [Clostridia bacterium]|nr:hypothetical protein [Clostridia bacterium]